MKFIIDKSFSLAAMLGVFLAVGLTITAFISEDVPNVLAYILLSISIFLIVLLFVLLSNFLIIEEGHIVLRRYFKTKLIPIDEICKAEMGKMVPNGIKGESIVIYLNNGEHFSLLFEMNRKLFVHLLEIIPISKLHGTYGRVSKRFYSVVSKYLSEKELKKYNS